MTTYRFNAALRQVGFGLIELMIGIVLGSILLLGLAKVFSASRNAYQASEGLARVQENSRFAMDFLQRDTRMAGHLGCVNDAAHFLNASGELRSHFLTLGQRGSGTSVPTWTGAPFAARFDVGVEGFEAAGSAPTNNLTLPAAGAWTPALPVELTGLANPPLQGSDVIVLRFLGSDSAPVTAYDQTTNKVTAPAFAAQIAPNGMYGIADCNTASVFQATATAAGGVITAGVAGVQKSGFDPSTEPYDPTRELHIYRAESVAYYIATSASGNGPALYRLRFTTNPAAAPFVPEELVEGIENMQILYGRETVGATPKGAVDIYQTAAAVNAAGLLAGDVPAAWRRVETVRIGLLSRSVDRGAVDANSANSPGSCGANCISVLGVNITPPVDAKVREAYLTTVALRNRLALYSGG